MRLRVLKSGPSICTRRRRGTTIPVVWLYVAEQPEAGTGSGARTSSNRRDRGGRDCDVVAGNVWAGTAFRAFHPPRQEAAQCREKEEFLDLPTGKERGD